MPLPETATAFPPTGSFTITPPADVLRFCETSRFSGTLAFQSDSGRGILPMLNGVPEVAPGDHKLEHALDQFLELTSGRYILTQMLPALEGSIADGELGVRGGLDRVTVLDLLRYCEGAGLTGNLTLHHSDRTCVGRYDHGELVSFTVDNEADADLANVFAWATGTFTVQARSAFDETRASHEPQDRLMKTLELALAQIFEKSQHGAEQAHPGTKPSISPPSMLRGSTLPFGLEGARGVALAGGLVAQSSQKREPVAVSISPPRRSMAPPPQGAESTVKVFFVDKRRQSASSATRHSTAGLGSEVLPLGDTSQRLDALDPADLRGATVALPPPPKAPDFTSQFGAVGRPVPVSSAPKIGGAVSLAATAKAGPPAKPSGTMGAVVPGGSPVAKPSGTMGAIVPGGTPVAKPSGSMGAVVPGASPPVAKPSGTMGAVVPGASPVAKPSGSMGAVVPGASPVAKPSGSMAAVVPGGSPVAKPSGSMAAVVPGGSPAAKPSATVAAGSKPAPAPSAGVPRPGVRPAVTAGAAMPPRPAVTPVARVTPAPAPTSASKDAAPATPAAAMQPATQASSVPAAAQSVRPSVAPASAANATSPAASVVEASVVPAVPPAAAVAVEDERTDWDDIPDPYEAANVETVDVSFAEPDISLRTAKVTNSEAPVAIASHPSPSSQMPPSTGSSRALATESITDDEGDNYPAVSSSIQLSREPKAPVRNRRRGALTVLFATTLLTTLGVAGYLLFGLVR